MLLACWSYGFGTVNVANALADAGLEPRRNYFVVLDELWRHRRRSRLRRWFLGRRPRRVVAAVMAALLVTCVVLVLIVRTTSAGKKARVDKAARYLGKGKSLAAFSEKGAMATAERPRVKEIPGSRWAVRSPWGRSSSSHGKT